MNRKKILVGDDSRIILKTLSMKLTAAGYDVLTAVEGGEAVDRPGPDVVPRVEELHDEVVEAEGGGLEEVERGVAVEEGGNDVVLAAVERGQDGGDPLMIAGGRERAVAGQEGVDLGAVPGADGCEEFLDLAHSSKVRGSGAWPQQ